MPFFSDCGTFPLEGDLNTNISYNQYEMRMGSRNFFFFLSLSTSLGRLESHIGLSFPFIPHGNNWHRPVHSAYGILFCFPPPSLFLSHLTFLRWFLQLLYYFIPMLQYSYQLLMSIVCRNHANANERTSIVVAVQIKWNIIPLDTYSLSIAQYQHFDINM